MRGSIDTGSMQQQRVCGCPNAASISNASPSSSSSSVPTLGSYRDGILAAPDNDAPAQAHLASNNPHQTQQVQRPIHLLRQPSFDPPPFNEEQPPPPMATPPPLYDHVIGTPSHDGLADYFERLSEFEVDQTDDQDMTRATNRGRVNVVNPRTLGGGIGRIFDIPRENFTFNPAAFGNAMTRRTENRTPIPGA